MKIIYINRLDHSDEEFKGIMQKMQDQKSAMQRLGHEVSDITYAGGSIMQGKNVLCSRPVARTRLSRFVFLHIQFFLCLKRQLALLDSHLLYIRYPYASLAFVLFLRKYKRMYPDSKIIVEIPTYPYAAEKKGILKLQMFIDWIWRRRLHDHVNRIVSFDQNEQIFGIHAVNISNGIHVPETEITDDRTEDPIRFVALGRWAFWHGLDRFLYGLRAYLDQDTGIRPGVSLSIVGTEDKAIRNLVRSLALENHVEFHGFLSGDALRKVLSKSHYGVGTLGIHRKGVVLNSSLKHRTYAAAGLPFLLSSLDPDFPQGLEFVYYAPANDEAIDLSDLLKSIPADAPRKPIRAYAMQSLSWNERMAKILSDL
ncbi:MAG: glycosyltransferase [Saprospiraceae bacterium]|nr:glycosyltransferase [Saprospiraceae bacterium]